jgi:hypothetical protein
MQVGERWYPIGGRSSLKQEHVEQLRATFGGELVKTRETEDGFRHMLLRPFEELSARFNAPGSFLLVPGEEMTSVVGVHTNAINVREPILVTERAPKSEVLEAQLEAVEAQSAKYKVPMIAHLNHMNWSSGVTVEEALGAPSLRFFEIYNGHPGTHSWGRAKDGMPPSDEQWDVMQSVRLGGDPDFPLLYGVATDDSHEYHKWGLGRVNPGRGWVMVQAEELTADALMRAMQDGLFYSTTGVMLEAIEKTADELRVTIDEEEGVTYRTEFIGTRAGFDTASKPRIDFEGNVLPLGSRKYSDEIGEVLLETTDNPAVYPFTGNELYVRARIYSDKLQDNPIRENDTETAWVQPVKP